MPQFLTFAKGVALVEIFCRGFAPAKYIKIKKETIMIDKFSDVVPSFFGMLNQGPLTLTIFLHTIIILPMFWIYASEKKRLQNES